MLKSNDDRWPRLFVLSLMAVLIYIVYLLSLLPCSRQTDCAPLALAQVKECLETAKDEKALSCLLAKLMSPVSRMIDGQCR